MWHSLQAPPIQTVGDVGVSRSHALWRWEYTVGLVTHSLLRLTVPGTFTGKSRSRIALGNARRSQVVESLGVHIANFSLSDWLVQVEQACECKRACNRQVTQGAPAEELSKERPRPRLEFDSDSFHSPISPLGGRKCIIRHNIHATHVHCQAELRGASRGFWEGLGAIFFFSNSINTRLWSAEPHVARLQFKPSSAGRGGVGMCAKSCQMGDVE